MNPAQSRWQLVVDPRVAALPVGRVLLSVAGALLVRTTPWRCIDEATDCSSAACVVDCAAFADAVAERSARLRAAKVRQAR